MNLVFNTFFTMQKIINQKGKTMSNQNEEIKLSNEYLNNNKQVLKLKESKTKKMYLDDKEKSKLTLSQGE